MPVRHGGRLPLIQSFDAVRQTRCQFQHVPRRTAGDAVSPQDQFSLPHTVRNLPGQAFRLFPDQSEICLIPKRPVQDSRSVFDPDHPGIHAFHAGTKVPVGPERFPEGHIQLFGQVSPSRSISQQDQTIRPIIFYCLHFSPYGVKYATVTATLKFTGSVCWAGAVSRTTPLLEMHRIP